MDKISSPGSTSPTSSVKSMDNISSPGSTSPTSSVKEDGRSTMQWQTRATSKSLLSKRMMEEKKLQGKCSGVGNRKKMSVKQSRNISARKKGKKVTTSVFDAFLGNAENYVANAQEQQKKREEDALKCGRVTRVVRTALKTMINPNNSTTQLQERAILKDMNGRSLEEFLEPTDSNVCHNVAIDFHQDRRHASLPNNEEFGKENDLFYQLVEQSKHKQSIREGHSPHVAVETDLRERRQHKPTPAVYDRKDFFEGDRRRQFPPLQGHQEEGQTSKEYVPYVSRLHGVEYGGSVRPGRSCSNSPIYDRRVERGRDFDGQCYELGNQSRRRESPSATQRQWQGHNAGMRQQSGHLSSIDNSEDYKKYYSPHMRQERRNQSPPKWTSPRSTVLRLPPTVGSKGNLNDSAKEFQRTKDVVILSPSADRKNRRQKQCVWEAQRLQREKSGKKPFFLTVDIGGRPFGPGRPAWIADINKLATALDPSCTDIRKQAHIDICTFKDRLNEHFEYSADLSEDYLRSLMGKAMTRKRTNLIRFINNGGNRPEHFDEEVWKRLELLATSQQREKRTEHGRYANSCRRTLGRTSATGEEGIRERLRELLRRSPDPHEVAEEMQRDKGYGKRKLGSAAAGSNWQEKHSHQVLKQGNVKGGTRIEEFQCLNIEEDEVEYADSDSELHSQAFKGKEVLGEMDTREMEWMSVGSAKDYATASDGVPNKLSKEDYIARLEAQVKSLRRETDLKFSSSRRRAY